MPTGVWKLFSAVSQALHNLTDLKSKKNDEERSSVVDKLNLVYSPENIVALNQSKIILSSLPSSHEQRLDKPSINRCFPLHGSSSFVEGS